MLPQNLYNKLTDDRRTTFYYTISLKPEGLAAFAKYSTHKNAQFLKMQLKNFLGSDTKYS